MFDKIKKFRDDVKAWLQANGKRYLIMGLVGLGLLAVGFILGFYG